MSFPTCPPRTSVAAHAWPGAAPRSRLSAPIGIRLDAARAFLLELLELDLTERDAGDEIWREWASDWLNGQASPADTLRALHESGAFAAGVARQRPRPPETSPVLVFARARAAVTAAVIHAEREHRADIQRRSEWCVREMLAKQRIALARVVATAPRRIP